MTLRWFTLIFLPAIYLTVIMCISGISTVFQIAVLHCYHMYPLREIPGWLKKVQACTCFSMKCTSRSRNSEVVPDLGDNGHLDKHDLNTGDHNVHLTHNEGEDVKTEPSTLGKENAPSPSLITEEITAGDEEENFHREWKKLAEYFDRLLFFIFTAIHLFILLFIFCAVPRIHALNALSS